MRIIVLFLILIFFKTVCFASVSDYIDSFAKHGENESYRSFSHTIKGGASLSDIDKQSIIDNELQKELNAPFIFTDLENCINIALEKNYEIRISKSVVDEAFWQNKNSQFQLLPNIFYNFNIMNLSGAFLVGGILPRTIHEVPIESIFGAEWSTIQQGRYFFLLAQTRNVLKSSRALLEFEKDSIILNTVLSYYEVLGKKLEMEVQKVNLYDRLEQLKYTQARFETGLGTLYDVKRAQAELAGAQQEYTETINSLRLRQADLALILGVDVLDAIYPFEISAESRVLVNPKYSIEELYQQALISREDIKAKKAEINAYRAKRSSNYADIIPDVSFVYQNGYVGTVRLGLFANNSIGMNIKASLGRNLLMGTISQIKSDSALVRQKKLELKNLERKVKQEIITSYYDSLNALKRIEASKIEVEAADVSLELSLASMKSGQATFIDVISSQNLKVQANITLIKNMIEYNKAQTKLLFDIGVISPRNVLKDYKSRFY